MALILPVGESGHGESPAPTLIAGVSSRRVLDAGCRQFCDLAAEQIGATLTVGRARRYADSRIKSRPHRHAPWPPAPTTTSSGRSPPGN